MSFNNQTGTFLQRHQELYYNVGRVFSMAVYIPMRNSDEMTIGKTRPTLQLVSYLNEIGGTLISYFG